MLEYYSDIACESAADAHDASNAQHHLGAAVLADMLLTGFWCPIQIPAGQAITLLIEDCHVAAVRLISLSPGPPVEDASSDETGCAGA